MYVCMYVCMYVYMCAYVCMCIYIHIYIYIYIYRHCPDQGAAGLPGGRDGRGQAEGHVASGSGRPLGLNMTTKKNIEKRLAKRIPTYIIARSSARYVSGSFFANAVEFHIAL